MSFLMVVKSEGENRSLSSMQIVIQDSKLCYLLNNFIVGVRNTFKNPDWYSSNWRVFYKYKECIKSSKWVE